VIILILRGAGGFVDVLEIEQRWKFWFENSYTDASSIPVFHRFPATSFKQYSTM